MPSNSLPFFSFFLLTFVGWTTRSKFCLVSSLIDYKTQLDSMDLLEIGPVNACEMAFKLTKICGKLLKEILLLEEEQRAKESF